MWVRIMKAGEFTNTSSVKGVDRVKNSMKIFNHGYAPLYALRKDHKSVDDPVLGPPPGPSAAEARHITIDYRTFLAYCCDPYGKKRRQLV